MTNRRQILLGAGAAAAAALVAGPALAARPVAKSSGPFAPVSGPRARVIVVNDLSGDIDGLFSTVHALLSPSTEVRAIVGTGTNMAEGIGAAETAARSAELAMQMLSLMRRTGTVPVHEGAPGRLKDAATPLRSAGTDAIIREAMRTDTKLPLYITVGGGLTEVASALMLEPAIADRFTLVWIGGNPYPKGGAEYNFNIDPLAACHVFNNSKVPIWQVPSNVYQACPVSNTELQAHVAPMGAIGGWLYRQLLDSTARMAASRYALNTGETWTLGDSPLVLLTALTGWVPSGGGPRGIVYERTGGSAFDIAPAPHLNADGTYAPAADARNVRIYKDVDTRLMFGDFFAKLKLNYG